MVFKPNSKLRERHVTEHPGAGDAAFRFFLFIAVLGCVWTTVLHPLVPDMLGWMSALFGSG
jgi:hypothetical protein